MGGEPGFAGLDESGWRCSVLLLSESNWKRSVGWREARAAIGRGVRGGLESALFATDREEERVADGPV
ncbi:hypothetical protein GCM10027039_30450 [Terrabacter koreensis]